MKHALDADHVAAVAALATRATSLRNTAKVAAAWAAGHGLTLLCFASFLIALQATLSPRVERLLEIVVGVMMVLLGVGVLRRGLHKRLHLHWHRHTDGVEHAHFHAHPAEEFHAGAQHEHPHPGLLRRAIAVGAVHGMAGTAALLIIALPALHSPLRAILYVGVFALGSVLGMVLFSVAVSLPVLLSLRRLGRVYLAAEVAVGVINIALGAWIVYANG